METKEEKIKINKFQELLVLILIYNTVLRMMGFPEDYAVPQFESKMWVVLIANCMAIFVFSCLLLWEKRKEKKKGVI